MSKRRRTKQLSDDDLREVEEFVYSKNAEEDKYLKSMSLRVTCKNENQKKVLNSIKNNEITISIIE